MTPLLILQFVCVDVSAMKIFFTEIIEKKTKKMFLYVYIGKIWRGLFLETLNYEFNHSTDYSSHDVRGLS